MAKPGKYLRIPMHQGLLESQESSKVPIGFMTELVNWVPEQTGGLRARGKWFKGSEDGLPATRQNRGIGTFSRFTDPAVVQASSVHFGITTGAQTPALTWTAPTVAGNTLVAVVGFASSSGSSSFGAIGWTPRVAVSTATNALPSLGVYELVTTQSYSGTVTPFTYLFTSAQSSIIIFILELQGVVAFDKVAQTNQTLANNGTTSFSATATTAVTTQASELQLGVVSSERSATTNTYTTTTPLTGFRKIQEGRTGANIPVSTARHALSAFWNTTRTVGTKAFTSVLTAPDTTGTTGQSVVSITYTGWNPDASPTAAVKKVLAANDNGATYDIWSSDRDSLDSATWTNIDATSNLSSTGVVAFVMGMGAAYYTGTSFARIRRYDGVSASNVDTSPVGANSLAISHDRMWAGGSPSYPARLFYSQLLDASTWTGTGTGYWDIGTEDGELIEDITPFNGGLLIGKQTSLWFLSGSSTSDFARQQLPSGGAAPGRSLLTTPFGAVVAGTDQVWLYDGDTVTRLGNAIEVSYGPEGYVTTSYQDGSIYIADPLAGRVYVFNLGGPVGTWRVEECEDEIGTLYNVGGRQFMGPYSTTIGSLVNYRDFPAPARGKDYDPLGMSYRMRTGDLWVDGALHPSTPRQMYLQLRQRGGDPADPGLVVTPVFNGVDVKDCDVGADNPGTRRVKVQGFPQKHRVGSFGFGITQTLASGDASVFDIEDAWVEYIQESTL